MNSITQTHNEQETIQCAKEFAQNLSAHEIILLSGTLGAGKSVFARALIQTLTNNPNLEVPSPTFTLVQSYETPLNTIHHLDLYRLQNVEDIYELGWEDLTANGITLIEWPERLEYLTPDQCIRINICIDPDLPKTRTINIEKKSS